MLINMLIAVINKTLILFFFMSLLVCIRHAYYFIQAVVNSDEEVKIRYKLSDSSLFYICISIAYIITTLLTGFKI
jgi:hypothetical protein